MEWDGVSAALARHAVVKQDERSIVVTVRSGLAAVRVRAERVRVFDEDWMLMIAAVCPEARALLRDALAANMRIAIAAHAIEQGWLVLRATHPLASLDLAQLERIVRFVSEEALRLRAIYLPVGTDVDRALGHFSE
jgi:hypothetical protein